MNREIEYFIQNFKQMLIFCKEYKMNTFFQIISQLIYFLVYFLFFDILSKIIIGIEYTKLELFLYLIIIDMCVTFGGIFDWGKPLKKDISKGKLNLYLSKPLSPFYLYQFSRINSNAFIQHIIAWIILFYFLIFKEISIKMDYFSILFIILIFMYYFLIKMFCNSISFFNFALSDMLYANVFGAGSSSFKQYPAQFFEFFPFKRFLIIFPMYFMGALLFEYSLFSNFQIDLLLILVSLIISFTIMTVMLWYFGLKKYEAFG